MNADELNPASADGALDPSSLSSAVESFVSGPKSKKATHLRQSGADKNKKVHFAVTILD